MKRESASHVERANTLLFRSVLSHSLLLLSYFDERLTAREQVHWELVISRDFLFGLPAIRNIHPFASDRARFFLRKVHRLRTGRAIRHLRVRRPAIRAAGGRASVHAVESERDAVGHSARESGPDRPLCERGAGKRAGHARAARAHELMSPQPGTTLGPYQVSAKIGEGVMFCLADSSTPWL